MHVFIFYYYSPPCMMFLPQLHDTEQIGRTMDDFTIGCTTRTMTNAVTIGLVSTLNGMNNVHNNIIPEFNK